MKNLDLLAKRIEHIEDVINKAKLEKSVAERQLNELRPQRDALDNKSLESFNCKVADLPKQLEKLETELEQMITDLEEDIKYTELNQ